MFNKFLTKNELSFNKSGFPKLSISDYNSTELRDDYIILIRSIKLVCYEMN